MPITIRQPGEAAAAAKAGTIIGESQRAKEDRAKAERAQARSEQIAAQQSARKAALEWEQQKMMLNSQQDFAHEMRIRQAGLDKEARAEEWQTEKMELASRIDFEYDEKKRLRDDALFDAGDKTITESDMPEIEKPRARFKNAMAHPNAKGAPQYFGYKEPRQVQAQTHRDKLLDIVGPYYKDESLADIEEAAIEAGYDPDTYKEFDLAPEDLRDIGLAPIEQPVLGRQSTAEELRALGTKEAYEKGKALGYWN